MKTILFSMFLLLTVKAAGQIDTCDNILDTTLKINTTLLKRLLKREFTQIYGPETKNGIGNYASLEPNSSSVAFSGNIVRKNDAISIKASGGVSDGMLSLFSNNKWSNNIGLDVQYNMFLKNKRGWNTVSLNAKEYQYYEDERSKIDCAFKSEQFKDIQAESCLKTQVLENELIIAKSKLQQDSLKARTYENKLTLFQNKNLDSLTYYRVKLAESTISYLNDSVAFQLKRQEFERLKCECNSLLKLCDKEIENQRLIKRNKAIKALENDLKLIGFRVHWFSFGYGVSNNSFRLYDPTKPFDQQFTLNSFATQEIRFQFNTYRKSRADGSYYASLWIKGSNADNFESLTKNDFEEITTDTSSTTVRKNTKKFSAYSGDYKKDLRSMAFGGDFYLFIPNNVMAFHFYPKYTVIQNLQPETSFGLGILMPFRKIGEEKTIINAELFMNTPNVFKTNGVTESNYFKRSEFGLRFTAPINFN